ncbi:oxidoreductase [Verrucomicrobiales bacterium BCK34]|nr:oxidoreductase [Verrucomicrobiales bacterium BCK34]
MESKVILVTGASSGIGKATAIALAEQGHRVSAGARRTDLMNGLTASGISVHFLDLTDENSIEEWVADILKREGRIDVLVNNAGYGVYGSVEDISIREAKEQFEVNLFGLARITQLVLPTMREQGSGTIINLSSMGGKVYTPLGAWYHASKHALEGWSDCLRIEVAPFGIHVAIIEPGAIETGFDKVLVDPLIERSQGGPYETLAGKMAKATRATFGSGRASSASVIARVIVKVIESKRPGTRYIAGYLARPTMIARAILPDRLFDWVIRTFL